MTKAEFLNALESYYGVFANGTRAKYFMLELEDVRGEDYEPLLREIFRARGAGWALDVKAAADAKKALKLEPREPEAARCPACGSALDGGVCYSARCPSNKAGLASAETVRRFLRELRGLRKPRELA